MIYDRHEMAVEYATCYADKSRITFIEKYFSTFNATKGKKTQFHCFPRQRAFLKALSENRNVVAVKPRQCGITTLSSAWAAAQCAFAPKDAPETILCIANKLEQAQEIIIKVRDFLEQVPRWYWGDEYFSPDPNSEKNITSIFLKDAKGELKLFNGCRVIARASGPNASRGISAVSVLILDEAAFIEEGVAAFTTAAATMASNPNSKTVMVSTPNGKDELYYNTYRQALSHENNFVAVQFRWYPPDAPWYDEMCKQFNNDSMKIAQELDVSYMGSSDNVIAPEYIEMQDKLNVREPLDDFKDPLVEETWFWKQPMEGHRYICAVDPSRGTAADRTAIEIIDMDGRDENGIPIIEQVAEYVGKRLGDDIGAIAYQYATMYNDAFVVVDATGGQGDACIITMLQMGYKNMYYEDMNQKTYMLQRATKVYDSYTDKLPGFHFQGNRYPVLANFAGLVRNNEFKIRSARVINELDTWIFKGDNARMDHMDGAHDDTITSLAMGLFVMQYSFNRLLSTVKKDKAILSSYMMTNSFHVSKPKMENGRSIAPGVGLPFYKQDKMKNNYSSMQYGNCMWLFGGVK